MNKVQLETLQRVLKSTKELRSRRRGVPTEEEKWDVLLTHLHTHRGLYEQERDKEGAAIYEGILKEVEPLGSFSAALKKFG